VQARDARSVSFLSDDGESVQERLVMVVLPDSFAGRTGEWVSWVLGERAAPLKDSRIGFLTTSWARNAEATILVRTEPEPAPRSIRLE
jgi:hypothetical protein